MGREQIAALIELLERENQRGTESLILGSWSINFDKERQAFVFDKCEANGYCEERPTVIAASGDVIDAGGPLFG